MHAKALTAYEEKRAAMNQSRAGLRPGNPEATAEAILKIVDAEPPPLCIVFGPRIALIRQRYAERLETWKEWEAVGQAAQGN